MLLFINLLFYALYLKAVIKQTKCSYVLRYGRAEIKPASAHHFIVGLHPTMEVVVQQHSVCVCVRARAL